MHAHSLTNACTQHYPTSTFESLNGQILKINKSTTNIL